MIFAFLHLRVDVFDRFAHCLETGLYQAGQMITPSPFSTAFRFNDFAIQRYAPRSQGIGIHRDGERYRHIVVIATLAGNSGYLPQIVVMAGNAE